MASSSSKSKSVALGKRAKIDSAQRYMLIFVCIASVLLGVTVVAVIYFTKLISFNMKLIGVKDEVIATYKSTQKNLKEISNSVSGLSTNEYLESVSRMRGSNCEGFDEKGMDASYSLNDLPKVRECSALRVITDSLPYTKNQDSALTSFYILLLLADHGAQIDNISATDFESVELGEVSLSTMNISADFKDSQGAIQSSLKSIEKSIRNFNVRKANLAYSEDEESGTTQLTLSASFVSFNAEKAGLVPIKRTVCAKKDNEKCSAAGGDDNIVELSTLESNE
jgi:hypothetical protein